MLRAAITSFTLVFTLCGCGAASDTPQAQNHSFTEIGSATLPSSHKAIFSAFKRSAGHQPEDLWFAAQSLDKVGARPMDAQSNRALEWRKTALKVNPKLAQIHPPLRGRVKGPAYREYTLEPGETDIIREVYYAAEDATLSIDPHNGSLVLNVLEVNEAEPVCNLKADADRVSCAWMPLFTAPYRISIRNTSAAKVSYILVSN